MKTIDVKNNTFRYATLALVTGLILAGGLTAAPPGRQPAEGVPSPNLTFVPNEMIVRFKPGYSSAGKQSLRAAGMTVPESLLGGSVHRVRLRAGQDLGTMLQEYRNRPDVEYAEPNYYRQKFVAPNDTNYGQLWGLKNTGQTITDPMDTDGLYPTNNPGTSGKDMDLETAWNTQTDCSANIVAVIDTGVNYNHSDLSANMWNGASCVSETGAALGSCTSGYDFVDNDKLPMDLDGHGTHVAGTIGARGNNGAGVTGVCWVAQIMAIRVIGPSGASDANIIKGLDFARQNGAKIINMSLGGPGFSSAVNDALTATRTAGILVVIAAGNGDADGVGDNLNLTGGTGGENDIYPCEYTQDNIICVAALTQNYTLTTFSNYGTTAVDVGAPGANILSTYGGQTTTVSDDFTSGWTFGGSWGRDTSTYYCAVLSEHLSYPSNYCNAAAGFYPTSSDHSATKTYTISSGADVVTLSYTAQIYVGSGDSFRVYSDGDATPLNGLLHLNVPGPVGSNYVSLSHSLTNCPGQTSCSVGFRMTTNSTQGASDYGIAIAGGGFFTLKTYDHGMSTYDVQNGTSMASPNTAGVAALLLGRNPNFTYTDLRTAILTMGDAETALATTTATGRAVDAAKSLQYIPQTVGVGLASP